MQEYYHSDLNTRTILNLTLKVFCENLSSLFWHIAVILCFIIIKYGTY